MATVAGAAEAWDARAAGVHSEWGHAPWAAQGVVSAASAAARVLPPSAAVAWLDQWVFLRQVHDRPPASVMWEMCVSCRWLLRRRCGGRSSGQVSKREQARNPCCERRAPLPPAARAPPLT